MTWGMLRRDARRLVRSTRGRIEARLGRQPRPFTSMTHPSAYPTFCRRAARDEAVFATFKREPAYAKVVEHLTCDEGALYLERLLEQSPELESALPLLRANDRLGGPQVCEYAAGAFSPTTLRYAKVLSDLLTLFGTLDGLRIVEIGGGYGGQCLVTSLLAKPASYTLIDLDSVLDLQETYLRKVGVRGAHFVSPDRLPRHATYDLAISNYAFSECARPTQEEYMERVLQHSARGYVTYNWWAPEWAGTPYGRDELLAAVPGSRFVPPVPQLIPSEELWYWGSANG
jgi:hypothetical protein